MSPGTEGSALYLAIGVAVDKSHDGAGAALYHVIYDLIEVVPLAANLHGAVDGDDVLQTEERNNHHGRPDGLPAGGRGEPSAGACYTISSNVAVISGTQNQGEK